MENEKEARTANCGAPVEAVVMSTSSYLERTRDNMRLCAHVMRAGPDKETLSAFTKEVEFARRGAVDLENLLRDWLVFARDVSAGDAAGEDWLSSLRRRTKEIIA